jgi:SAM-dependent methyltransferase
MGCGTGENIAFLALECVDAVDVAVGVDLVPAAVDASASFFDERVRQLSEARLEDDQSIPTDIGDLGNALAVFICADVTEGAVAFSSSSRAAFRYPTQSASTLEAASSRCSIDRFEGSFDFVFDCQTFHCLFDLASPKPNAVAVVSRHRNQPEEHTVNDLILTAHVATTHCK